MQLGIFVPTRLAHKEQQRKSGEPYIVHPVAVAELLALLKADWTRSGLNFWRPFLADFFSRYLVVIKRNESSSPDK